MKKKLLSLALVLVMALTLLPTAAFAEDGTNLGDPPEQSDSNILPPAGDPVVPDSGIQPLDDTCTGAANCPATNHNANCIKLCTESDSCPNTAGNASVHKSGCPKATAATTPDTCTGKEDCTAKTHNKDCISQCTKNDSCQNTEGKAEAHKADCPKAKATTPPSDPSHTHILQVVNGTPATCKTPGTQLYYKCTVSGCNKLFSDPEGKTEIAKPVEIPVTSNHTAPNDGTGGYLSATQHTYTCTVCGQTATGSHTYVNGVCTVCNTAQTSTPSPYNYIDITSAYVNSYSISVTWASDLPDGTSFEIYVDGSWRTTVTPSKSGSYFSATVSSSRYLDDSYYYVAVYRSGDHTIGDSVRVYGRYYDGDYDYWYDHYYPNSTPGTNSHGIPYASQVNGRYSASEAIRILRNKNANDLQNELMGSSSARDSYDSLERAVKNANNVSVTVSTDRSGVPSALRSGAGIQISGAAFNASRTNSTVRLVVDAPSVNRYTGRGYQFSMTLTGVDSASSLDVPVVVSMPLPSDINSNFVRVLHYHNSNIPTVIIPQVSGGRIRFPLTGFSDFVITDNGVPAYTYISDGYGGYYVPVGQVARRSLAEEQLAVALPIIASLPASGYVFNDVSGTYWASGEIAWARDSGILSGYYDGSFRPYAATTRQELWMVLARLSGASPADMRAAREWAMNAGITDGTKPESPLSTQQMIAMLYRYASYRGMNLAAPSANLSLYRDGASVSAYARTPMSWAINRGIVTGNGTSYLHPQDIATRADFAVYLYRFLQ